MTTLGMIGGIAPESTIEYYRTIVALHRERTGGTYPSIIIDSIDLPRMMGYVAGDRPALVRYLVEELGRLAAAGADLALFASNTPHIVFDEVAAVSPMPLISIVDSMCRAAEAAGLHRLGLFGTRFTMSGGFYAAHFAKRGMEIVVPSADEQELLHKRYMEELVPGRFLPETRAETVAIIERMARDSGIEAVILGGTELPLLLREPAYGGVRMLDTMRLHAEVAVEEMLK
jgi:aspartate racemase